MVVDSRMMPCVARMVREDDCRAKHFCRGKCSFAGENVFLQGKMFDCGGKMFDCGGKMFFLQGKRVFWRTKITNLYRKTVGGVDFAGRSFAYSSESSVSTVSTLSPATAR